MQMHVLQIRAQREQEEAQRKAQFELDYSELVSALEEAEKLVKRDQETLAMQKKTTAGVYIDVVSYTYMSECARLGVKCTL